MKKKMLEDKYMDKKKFNLQLRLSVVTLNTPQIRVPTEQKSNQKWKQNSYSFIFSEFKRM